MPSQFDGLERLGRMLDQGKITQDEFESLKAEILGSDRDIVQRDLDSKQKSAWYAVSLALGVLSVFLGGTLGLLAWTAVILSIGSLIMVRNTSGRWMAWVGLSLGVVFSLMNLYLNDHISFGAQGAVGVAATATTESQTTSTITAPTTTTSTTTAPTTTTTIRVTVPTQPPGPDEGEVVEELRRTAALISEAGRANGIPMFTSVDLMTDQQVIADVEAICDEVQGSGQGMTDRIQNLTPDAYGQAELVLLRIKLKWASWYCPTSSTYLRQLADEIREGIDKLANG